MRKVEARFLWRFDFLKGFFEKMTLYIISALHERSPLTQLIPHGPDALEGKGRGKAFASVELCRI